jgi:hypothetical protein
MMQTEQTRYHSVNLMEIIALQYVFLTAIIAPFTAIIQKKMCR